VIISRGPNRVALFALPYFIQTYVQPILLLWVGMNLLLTPEVKWSYSVIASSVHGNGVMMIVSLHYCA